MMMDSKIDLECEPYENHTVQLDFSRFLPTTTNKYSNKRKASSSISVTQLKKQKISPAPIPAPQLVEPSSPVAAVIPESYAFGQLVFVAKTVMKVSPNSME
jgi:hypothetical protein